jgi:hypothetical protein
VGSIICTFANFEAYICPVCRERKKKGLLVLELKSRDDFISSQRFLFFVFCSFCRMQIGVTRQEEGDDGGGGILTY